MRHALAFLFVIKQAPAHAALLVAIFFAAAHGGVERLVDRRNDVGHRNALQRLAQVVAAAGAAHRLDNAVAAQLAKQLLKVRQRDALALADRRQGHRAIGVAQRQINHGGDGEAAFGGQSHGEPFRYG